MKINQAIALRISIPFKQNTRHNLKIRGESSSIIVSIKSDNNILGFGEGDPRSYVTNESGSRILRIFDAQIKPVLIGKEFKTKAQIHKYLNGLSLLNKFPSLLCALELALLDILEKKQSVNNGKLLFDKDIDLINYSGAIPFSYGLQLENNLNN